MQLMSDGPPSPTQTTPAPWLWAMVQLRRIGFDPSATRIAPPRLPATRQFTSRPEAPWKKETPPPAVACDMFPEMVHSLRVVEVSLRQLTPVPRLEMIRQPIRVAAAE